MFDKTTGASPGDPHKTIEGQTRCLCNKLVCVINGDNIEIKCNKCKRLVTIRTRGVLEINIK